MDNIYQKYAEEYKENLLKRKGQEFDKAHGAIFSDKEFVIKVDENGNKLTSFTIHQILLMILREIKRVCEKNNIPFALGFGTALGMYNYKGFIPWDDDADIVINMDDLDRFVEALKNDLGDDFTFDCYETNHRYNVLNPTMKIRYKHSYIKESNSLLLPNRCKNGDGIFVDVCAFSNVPSDLKTHTRLRMKSFFRVPYYCVLDGLLRIHPYLTKKILKKFERKVHRKYENSGYVSQSIIVAWQALDKDKTKILYPKEMIYPFMEREFEGEMFPFFNDVEGFLKRNYCELGLKSFKDGKWVESYPEEKQKIRHFKKVDVYK